MKTSITCRIIITAATFLILTGKIFADGFIIIDKPSRPVAVSTPFPLEVKYHHVNVKINELAAVTEIDQEFYNPTAMRLEGYYLFPIPAGAVIKKFSMFINGKETEAELLDSNKARRIYEDIVRQMRDPALLEYHERGLFRARIFPIEPNSAKRIKITYDQILSRDNGTVEYVYPLNTEKFSARPLKDVAINVDIKTADNLKNVYCTSHDAEVVRKENGRAIISFEQKETKPDIDFKIYYSTDKSGIGLSLLTYKNKSDDGYFFLDVSPGLDTESATVTDKDITFVLDVSGSMAGKKLEQAKKALLFCVENLNKNDRFQVVRFSTEADALFTGLSPVNNDNLKRARTFISNLKAIGGTYIEEALKLALKEKGSEGRPHVIVFITDGMPTIGETSEDKLVNNVKSANTGNTRIFTFGVGNEINTHLLDKITTVTRAYRTYISPEEDIEIKISDFYTKVQSPVLTDIIMKFNGVTASKYYPAEMPDIFRGSSVTLLGRYKNSGAAKITLEGRAGGKEMKFEYSVIFSEEDAKNDFIPSLWAARRIGYLLDQIRLNGENREIVDEITQLAREHGIVTPYTSYLILEDEQRRIATRELEAEDQTIGAVASRADLAARSKKEYAQMKDKSGAGSVRASEEFQALNKAMNIQQMNQGESRLDFKDSAGNSVNIASQVRKVQGRAFYNSGKLWIDSRVQDAKKNRVRIQFGSAEYFDLLKKETDAAEILALGRNVRFVLKGTVYEISE
ncbi:MAG: VIT and VWA domain-containing protein [Spirochaetes bacterium]|nr:VIT and VWA domain-containing protein [Spirochaetota bacterium]